MKDSTDFFDSVTFKTKCGLNDEQATLTVRFLKDLSGGTRLSTVRGYRNTLLTHLTPEWFRAPDEAAQQLRDKSTLKNYAYNYNKANIAFFARFVNWLQDELEFDRRVLKDAKARLRRVRRGDRKSPPKVLSCDECRALMSQAVSHPNKRLGVPGTGALLLIYLHAGLRSSEGHHITWSEIDFDAGVINLMDTPHRHLKTTRAVRTIPMTVALQGFLDMVHKIACKQGRNGPHDLVFQTARRRDGSVIDPIFDQSHPFNTNRKLKVAGEKKGQRRWPSPLSMRRTFLSALWGANLDLPLILDLAGHGSVQTSLAHYVGQGSGIPELDPMIFDEWAKDPVRLRKREVEAAIVRASGKG
jgi:integrase